MTPDIVKIIISVIAGFLIGILLHQAYERLRRKIKKGKHNG